MSTVSAVERIGVGIDTARYGHRVSFLRPDRQPAARPLTVTENPAGYHALQQRLEQLQRQHPQAHFHVHIDAAGQYAANLERFLRSLSLPMTVSIGEPKRNKDYQKAHFPKRTTDDTESQAMARFAVVELPPATPPLPPDMAVLREVAGRLQAQVKQSTQAVNRLHNLMARVFPELAQLTNNFAAVWVLTLLDQYPTATRIGRAQLDSIRNIPYLDRDLAEQIHLIARQSVASLSGEVAEALVRDLVAQVRQTQRAEEKLRQLLEQAYRALPPSPHAQVITITGIGPATAAALVAQAVDINRFATPRNFVSYFGIFPEVDMSGVDKHGNPLPPGTLRMSRKGNDLVRAYLWNAAKSAIVHNPVIAALYKRLRERGRRGDVALGHCMRKLLHLVYAVWKTNRPFDPNYRRPAGATPARSEATATAVVPEPTATAVVGERVADDSGNKAAVGHKRDMPAEKVVTTATAAVGHKRDMPAEKVVTTATATVRVSTPTVKSPPNRPARPKIDYAYLRSRVSLEQVLSHLGLLGQLRGRGLQRRGPCPLHAKPGDTQPTFSAHLGKNVFQCFHAGCQATGNALDFWVGYHKLPLYEAALQVAAAFGLPRNREEEPVVEPVTNGSN
jgi:transposase